MNRKKDIEQLFRQHYAKMYNLARCILSDDDESKDISLQGTYNFNAKRSKYKGTEPAMKKRAACSSCQEETLLINNEYMTIGQAKAKPCWFALCLTDVFISLLLDIPLFVALIPEGRL